jgi:hypothetical protein
LCHPQRPPCLNLLIPIPRGVQGKASSQQPKKWRTIFASLPAKRGA